MIHEVDSDQIFVVTLTANEASILAHACESIRQRLESIARANKLDQTLDASERQTVKDACTAINAIAPKLRTGRNASHIRRSVREIERKWRGSRRKVFDAGGEQGIAVIRDDTTPRQ